MKSITSASLSAMLLFTFLISPAALAQRPESYRNIEMVEAAGDRIRETDVRVEFRESSMALVSAHLEGRDLGMHVLAVDGRMQEAPL